MSLSLTPNAISKIYNGVDDKSMAPVVQCIDIRRLGKNNPNNPDEAPPDRYRLVLSDGTHFQQAMLGTQQNQLIHDNLLVTNSVIRLDDFLCNDYQGRRIIIVLKLSVQGQQSRIGNPTKIESGGGGSAPAAAASSSASSSSTSAAAAGAGAGAGPSGAPAASSVMPAPSSSRGGPSGGSGSGPIARQNESHVVPISSLNLYSGKWTIKARVTSKSNVRTWNNARGSGKLFSMDLLDDTGGEIRATLFQDAVDTYFDVVQPDRVYYISGGQVKHANPQFNTLKNDYELSLDRNCIIEAAPEDSGIPKVQYHFAEIEKLLTVEVNTTVDLLGVIIDVGDVSEFVSQRSGKEMIKRPITVADTTMRSVDVTVWGDVATNFSGQVGQVAAFKGCRVGDFNGRSLSASFGSTYTLDPELPEAYALKDWYNQKTAQGPLQPTPLSIDAPGRGMGGMGGPTPRKCLSAIQTEGLGHGVKPDYFTTRAWVQFLREQSLFYEACAAEGCQKKVVRESDGQYTCEKCGHRDSRCDHRYIASAQIVDQTGSQWVTCFNTEGETLLGVPASEMADLREQGNEAAEKSIIERRLLHQFLFKIRCKAEMVQEEMRIRCTAASLEPVNFSQECKHLLKEIKAYGM